MKWLEAFGDYLHRKVGVRGIPLAYITREDAVPVGNAPPLATGKSYSDEHGSVAGELVARATHNHPMFRTDNNQVYFELEEATRGTQYAATIRPSNRNHNGREAYLSLVAQHAGADKWITQVKKDEDLLVNRR